MGKASASKNGFAPAERSELRFLIGKCLPVGCFRIDDLAQCPLTVHHHTAIVDVLTEIASFLRILIEIEKLRRHADIVDVFKTTFADHEGAGSGANRMILAHHRAAWCGAANNVE